MIVKASASATSRRLLMSHSLFVGVGSRPPRDDLTKARPPSRRWQFRTVQHATSVWRRVSTRRGSSRWYAIAPVVVTLRASPTSHA